MCDNEPMEVDVPMEHIQGGDGDNGSCQVITDCLDLPEKLRKIMQSFSTTELMELSVVNKQWNYEARSLMKSRGNLIAKLGRNTTCQVLEEFASDLRKMEEMRKIMPLSGAVCHFEEIFIVKVYKDILNLVTWKRLSLEFAPGWEKHKSCPPFRLVKKILHMYCGVLEELSLLLNSRQRDNIQQVFQNRRFPHLKTLRFMDCHFSSIAEDSTTMIKALISIAPNLQVLYTECHVNLSANLLEGSSAIHVANNYPFYVIRDEIPESLIGRLSMQRLELSSLQRNFNLQRFNWMTSALLESSRTTLSWMSIEIMFLIPLTCYGIRLENLKGCEINLDYQGLEGCQPRILRLVMFFDFTRIFPNLSEISITKTLNPYRSFARIARELSGMVEQGNPAFESVPARAVNIKKLALKWQSVTEIHSSTPFLAEMFPEIEKLSIETHDHDIPLAGMWDSWPDLKELEVTLSRWPLRQMNLDSALCGLFPDEVAELREKDDEYLKALNIVPVMPSIACFKGLRTFKLVCDDDGRARFYDPSCLPSKVTGRIAFQRCPDLTVTVTTNNKDVEEAMSWLKPYASIVPFH